MCIRSLDTLLRAVDGDRTRGIGTNLGHFLVPSVHGEDGRIEVYLVIV